MHKILPSTTSVKEEKRVLRMFSPTKSFLPPSFLFSPSSSTLTFPSRSLGLAKEGPPSPLSVWLAAAGKQGRSGIAKRWKC